ncbi:hypothetical protein WAI453_002998 [Rhynchosporium graminicola]|uniref:EamA domain-containing protein n=1 Tax=Rhynchosporium graminicola TaxID=2792576 RepID=A0A1E1LNX5_9HELO|nr:uncharacterized protein RCO7_02287 [Rhynchosporium commune]
MARRHSSVGDYESAGIEPPESVWSTVWRENRGALYIILAQVFGSSMDAIVRFLQQGGNRMHPFQIIVGRMGITFVLSSLYMWWTKVPNFPLGDPKVRLWLFLRAFFGFGGMYCLVYSVHYLPLAEATVLRFLVPLFTAWACSVFLGQTFFRKDIIAGLVAMIGVIFIAHPASIFGKVDDMYKVTDADEADHVTSNQRLIAIAVSLLGVLGAVGAYTMIRVVGDRAHALISVNYFAFFSTASSAIALLVIPGIGFTMTHDARQWILLALVGIFGFILQFLLTAGLQLDRSSKATSMLYTQVLFALSFDWAIWGVIPGGWSLFGGAIVIGSTLWSALQKPQKEATDLAKSPVLDEESPLLGAEARNTDADRRRESSST